MGRFENLRSRVAELIDTSDDPEPKGYAGDEQPTGTIVGNYLENNPPKEQLDEYWKLYRDVGLIQGAIDNFASEVIEPGWYITADDEDTREQLTDYMENVAITNLEHDQNFTELARKMIVEREVRGTVFIEKVTDDQGRNEALYPLQNDTITIYTKAGKAILPAPGDEDATPIDPNINDNVRVPKTEDGQTGAYVQFDDVKPRWDSSEEVVYTRDEVIHWPRDPDVGEARGVSRIRSIQNRAEGWLQKVQDNDAAIRSKAWPMIIFNMGTEENPWTQDQVEEFLEAYDNENLEPGMMQAVSGDVSVDEFAGETADIEAALQHDVNTIMSGMPGPVYATGGFSQNVAPAVAKAQERQFIKEVKATRRDLENKITPYLREVAEDYDLDDPDSVEFHVGRPSGEVAPEDVSGSIIRYTSDADPSNQGAPGSGAQQGGGEGATNEGGQQGAGAPSAQNANPSKPSRPSQPTPPSKQSPAAQSEGDKTGVFGASAELEGEELADPRFVSTTEYQSDLSGLISDVLLQARTEALSEFKETYDDSPVAGAGAFDGIAKRSIESTLQDSTVDTSALPIMEDVVEDTIDTVNQDNHGPKLDVTNGIRHRQRARTLADNVERQVRQAAEDMLNDITTQVRRAAQRGESPSVIAERVEDQYSDEELEERADLIAHMELQNAVNTTKLVEYDRSSDVDGIKVINTCGESTTPLCEHLAGCGGRNAPTAMFDDEESISDQLESAVPEATLFDGFDPLPPAPPFHYGCTSEIVAVSTSE